VSSKRKQYDVSRPSTGMKPRGFSPTKKKPEENLASQISEEAKDSE
jgi:hypothetical protein